MIFFLLLMYSIGVPLIAGLLIRQLQVKRRRVLIHLFMLAVPATLAGISMGLFDTSKKAVDCGNDEFFMPLLYGMVAVIGQVTTYVILDWLKKREAKKA